MTMTDHESAGSGDLVGFDSEGFPMFERDNLDDRYGNLIERIQAGADKSWFAIDQAVGELLAPTAALRFAEEFLEVLAAMVQRERGRLEVMVAEQERRLLELRRGLPR